MFDDLWEFVKAHCKILAQEKSEMVEIFNLMKDAESYLEIGTAEGNSLYVFGHALKKGSDITYVDGAEKHTQKYREGILNRMGDYKVMGCHGNSHDPAIIKQAQERRYDIVFIDAGHTYNDVMQDARNYAPLADKYIFFHDVQMPEVMQAYNDWLKESGRTGYTIIKSIGYGYGVVKV